MAAGRTDEALKRLQSAPPSNEFGRRKRLLAELAMRVDAGRWAEVDRSHAAMRSEMTRLEGATDTASYRQLQAFRLAELTTRRTRGAQAERLQGLQSLVEEALRRHAEAAPTSRSDTALVALYLGYHLAREGDLIAAEQLFEQTRSAVADSPRATVADVAALLEARIALAQDDAARAFRLLDARTNGQELLLVRTLRGEAARRLGNLEDALADAEYVSNSRGRAYAEWAGEGVTLVENAQQVNLAHLRAAEIALELGRSAVAREHFDYFVQRWPDYSALEGLSDWVARLQRKLKTAATKEDAPPHSPRSR
jgi:tetratricopeptide (TPR) repeat protein